MIANLRQLLPVLLMAATLGSCHLWSRTHWTDTLPASAPLVIIPNPHASLGELLERDYVVWMDQLTPARMSDIRTLGLDSLGIRTVRAIAVVPSGARNWSPLWVMDVPDPDGLRLPAPVNQHRFGKHTVRTYQVGDARITVAMVGNTLLVSDNSQAVEDALAASAGRGAGFPLQTRQPAPGSILAQGSLLYQLAGLETVVETHPALKEALAGLPATLLTVSLPDHVRGTLSLQPDALSPMMRGFTGEPAGALLAGYFPADAIIAAKWLRMPPPTNDPLLAPMRLTFDEAVGYTGIPSGDGIWIRILRDPAGAQEAFQPLVRLGAAIAERDMYRITDPDLTAHITAGLSSRTDVWARISGNALYVAEKPGAIARVIADRSRDRILANDEAFIQVRDAMPLPWSGFVFLREKGLIPYLKPWLQPDHRLATYTSTFDAAALVFRGDGIRSADLELRLFRFANTTKPVVDGWSTNLDGYGTSGPPTLADITGDGRHDVVVSTTGGRLYAFGTDGVELFSAGMEVESVMGSPSIADWYGNGDPVIMVGADNQVYAWQRNGTLLPQFPLQLHSRLSAPITLADPSGRNQLELIVATTDRTVARLDRRGRPAPGWPQPMADIATEAPFMGRLWDRRLVVAYADDQLYAWELNGTLHPGFPIGLPSPGTGSIQVADDHVLIGTLAGELVAIGPNGYFQGVSTRSLRGGLTMQRIRTGGQSMRLSKPDGEWIGAVGQDGQIRVYDRKGQMVFADELFVTMSTSEPVWVDLNQDGRNELVATSVYGRVYAWDVANRRKIETLPPITTYDPSFSRSFGPDAIPYMVSDTPTGIRVWRLQGSVSPTDP